MEIIAQLDVIVRAGVGQVGARGNVRPGGHRLGLRGDEGAAEVHIEAHEGVLEHVERGVSIEEAQEESVNTLLPAELTNRQEYLVYGHLL